MEKGAERDAGRAMETVTGLETQGGDAPSRVSAVRREMSEAEMIAGARAGDGTAFEAIMRRNNRVLFRSARSILGNDAEAEEVVQETYLKAYTRLGGFDGRARLTTWLVRIAVNDALDRLRRRMPGADLDELTDRSMSEQTTLAPSTGTNSAALADTASPEASAARGEIRLLLERAIDALPQAQRTVFVLRALEQFSVEETSDSLGIPEATVKTRFHRAKRQLRSNLSATLETTLGDSFPFAGERCDRIVAGVLARLELDSDGLPDP